MGGVGGIVRQPISLILKGISGSELDKENRDG
jgi:hypothetical protein